MTTRKANIYNYILNLIILFFLACLFSIMFKFAIPTAPKLLIGIFFFCMGAFWKEIPFYKGEEDDSGTL